MLRSALVLSIVASAALTASQSAAAASSYFAPEPPSTSGAPFSAVVTTQSTTTFADGNRIVRTNTVRYFRDGEGRTRTERGARASAGSAAAAAIITINDPVNGKRYILYPQRRVAMGLPIRSALMSPEATDAGDDFNAPFGLLGFGMGVGAKPVTEASVSETSLGKQLIQGVSAIGTRVVRTIPAGVLGNDSPITSTRDTWFSAELGLPIQITQKSSIGGVVTLTLEQLTRAEPDPSLFTPPADYKLHEIGVPLPTTATSSR